MYVEKLIGRSLEEAELFLNKKTVRIYNCEYAVIMKSYFFGFIKKRLHLSVKKGIIYDCFIRIDL
ncbi:hypothetical protein EGI05_09970 [Chryseobacterium daecheongense]|uniref:Uncharacterized protein n=1 Tax=Chryseobacterium daecheongense TaxID=192389 RepID=A0A3N0VY35_9FLAO|nr:hypothetical protein EGI05_09970 [Chryseobacterium daecheongense]